MPSGSDAGHRVFHLAPPWPPPGAEATLSVAESRHALRVLRLQAGDTLRLIDAAGRQAQAVALGARGGCLRVRVGPADACPGEAHLAGRLALPLIRSAARLDWAIEKATELGAAAFEVYRADRSLKGVARDGEGRNKRWERVALAAMKQSGRALAPPVRVHADLDALLEALPTTPLLAGDVRGQRRPPGDWLAREPGERLLLVGPEGGWSEREDNLLAERGAARLSLGPRRLRVETAAVALCAAVLAQAG